ncbi:hypothetical protein BMS3Bbin04_00189 [bacterium BMS3Bbin04]|nr:hypothetical protein BMS3Bbin04_00189 [bacterium BMS3Bbin04]
MFDRPVLACKRGQSEVQTEILLAFGVRMTSLSQARIIHDLSVVYIHLSWGIAAWFREEADYVTV